ncbi:MAG: hypothetical protein VKL59_11800 [Nostocaceae cyanobacterium]|nr:hypothetical protein [Nostocaceae cyanobacterium]
MSNSKMHPTVIGVPGQPDELTLSETYSKNVMGPVVFELYDLNVGGASMDPADPAQSQYIVATNESYTVSLKIKFNDSPLTKLLLCLGVKINVTFALEGIGAGAVDKDLTTTITTSAGVFNYVASYTGTPDGDGLAPGFYEITGVVTIGPAEHPCAQFLFGAGYISKVLLQVYKAF